MLTAAELNVGDSAVIVDVDNDHPSSHRILEMGFTPGQEIRYLSGGVFTDPMAFAVRGSIIAIRRKEALCILVKRQN